MNKKITIRNMSQWRPFRLAAAMVLAIGAYIAMPLQADAATVLASDMSITTDSQDQTVPAIAFDTLNNRFLVVWTDERNGNKDIYGAFVDQSTGTAGTSFKISNSAGLDNQFEPSVAFDSLNRNRFLVVWTDARNDYNQIYGTTLDNNGSVVASDFAISSHTTTGSVLYDSQSQPRTTFNPITGNFDVTWLDTSNLDRSYTYSLECIAGAPATGSYFDEADDYLIVSKSVTPGGIPSSSNDARSAMLVNTYWTDCTAVTSASGGTGTLEIDVTYYAHESSPSVASDTVNGTAISTYAAKSVVASLDVTAKWELNTITNTVALVSQGESWSDNLEGSDTNQNVYFFESSGLSYGYYLRLSGDEQDSTAPAMAIDSVNDRALVVWESGGDIYGFIVDIQGASAYGSRITISSGDGSQSSPSAAFDTTTQRFLVAWQDERTSSTTGWDIYGQYVNTDGSLTGANFGITTNSSNQMNPTVGVEETTSSSGNRRTIVAWTDTRNGVDSDVYAQLLEFSTDDTSSSLEIVTSSLSSATVGETYNESIEVTGGVAPYTYEMTSGTLDAGLTFDPAGIVYGTPSIAGTYTFLVTVTDGSSDTASKSISLEVAESSGTTDEGDGGDEGDSEACFIATAAYGSYMDPHVAALRAFRDSHLMTNAAGRAFVDFYYSTSPRLAAFIARHDALRAVTRIMLAPVVAFVVHPTAMGVAFFASLGAVGVLSRRKRR